MAQDPDKTQKLKQFFVRKKKVIYRLRVGPYSEKL